MSEDCNRTAAQQLFDEAWMLKLSPGLKLVLMSMCEAADEDGVFRKGLTFLVLDTEYCAAQIGRIIKSLIEEKLVEIVEQKSGRRAATYSFSLSGYPYKLSIQNGYTKVLSIQNVELTEGDENNLSIQNVDTTHSHDVLSTQNVGLNGDGEIPPNNPPKDKDLKANTRAAQKQDARGLLDLSPEVSEIMALFDNKPQPDIKLVQLALEHYPFESIKRGVLKALLNPKVRDLWAYANTMFGDELNPPPISAAPPSKNGKRQPEPPREVPPEIKARNARIMARVREQEQKKVSGQS